jgi:transposase
MIRTSKLSTKFTNKIKKEKLQLFIELYKNVVNDYIDILWNNLTDNYECPKFISTKNYKNSTLSQRAIKCASTQACSMVKASTEQTRKLIWTIGKLKEDPNNNVSFLEQKLAKIKMVKPALPKNFKLEINSICCDLVETNGFWFLQLKSIGKQFSKIRIPIKPHRQTNKWKKAGQIKNSFLVSENFVDIRFKIENKLKSSGKTLGLDQGISSCITLSDGQTSKDNEHGWNLSKILQKLCSKKKGSKGFARIQELRKNYINWSINKLNLTGVKQLNIEKLRNVRKGKRTDRFRSHWTYTIILDKLKRYCEEQKVSVKEQCCVYRSQRCCVCGLVRESQRKGKKYSCQCGHASDADLNASLNHECELPAVDHLRHLGHNIAGFYWNPEGIFDLNGNELTVRCTNKDTCLV